MSDTSTKWGIVEPSAARTDAADVPLYVRNIVAALEAKGVQYGQGTLAARPAAGTQGRIYLATDQAPPQLYFDTGSAWNQIGALAAGAVGTTETADASITLAKMAPNSVDGSKIIDGSVTTAELLDGTVTAVDLANALKPSAGAGAAVEALRALGLGAGLAAPGTHASQHAAGGGDPIVITQAMLDASVTGLLPQTGDIKMVGYDVVAGTNEPSGWLLCDGRTVTSGAYPALVAKLSGGASAVLPDARSRSPMGKGQGAGLTLRNVGQLLGEELHPLTVSEMPNHGHTISDPGHGHILNDPGHGHGASGSASFLYNQVANNTTGGSGNYVSGIPGNSGNTSTNAFGVSVSVSAAGTGITMNAATTGISVVATGGGGGHNTIHPVFVVSFLIKT